MSLPPIDADMYLAARDEAIKVVDHILSGHRPERIKEQRVVTCTGCFAEEPHEIISTQWPGWREHVAPLIVDALIKMIIEGAQ